MGPLTSVSQNLIRNHHHQVSEVGCNEYDCSRITLRYEATQLDMFKHMDFEGNMWYHADQTRAHTGQSRSFLTHIAQSL